MSNVPCPGPTTQVPSDCPVCQVVNLSQVPDAPNLLIPDIHLITSVVKCTYMRNIKQIGLVLSSIRHVAPNSIHWHIQERINNIQKSQYSDLLQYSAATKSKAEERGTSSVMSPSKVPWYNRRAGKRMLKPSLIHHFVLNCLLRGEKDTVNLWQV